MTRNEIRLKLESEGYSFTRKTTKAEFFRRKDNPKLAAMFFYNDNSVTYWKSV